MSTTKTSGSYRALEIILGLIALAIGVLALVFPTAVVVTLVVFFGIALVIIGILRLATSISSNWAGSTRTANAVIGLIALIIGLVILFVPFFATDVLVILIGIGLLVYGIGRIAVGGADRHLSGGLRGILIIVGLLIVAFALIIIFFPVVGIYTYAFFVSIAFILIGIESIAAGLVGTTLT
jgi:uncharacterized membrane protein HdeD (DUF308 family)